VLIHPWDAATREQWRGVIARNDFGQLITAGHVGDYPVVVPTHFVYDGDATVLLHLARPNPIWAALEDDPHVVLSLATDWAYVEAAWNADPGTDPTVGVPTSYYTAVQLLCTAEIVDDAAEKLAILAIQLEHSERPGSARVTPTVDVESDRRQVSGIRAIRLHLEEVRAKQKYGGNKTPEHRQQIAAALAERNAPGDRAARAQLLLREPRPD
jgi:transcriptional regulator